MSDDKTKPVENNEFVRAFIAREVFPTTTVAEIAKPSLKIIQKLPPQKRADMSGSEDPFLSSSRGL